jgi:hypothetical protein
MMAARLSPGAISDSSSSHLPVIEGSKLAKPVMFAPGRSSRGTRPLATGSATAAKTIGMVRVSRWRTAVAGVEFVRMTSGCSLTNSWASARNRLVSPPAPANDHPHVAASVQPKAASACVNGEPEPLPVG